MHRTLAALFSVLLVAGADAQDRVAQNVILIMTDDQGYGDLGFHGNPVLRTPNLDRMAEESARLDRFYVSPVCTPTRAALMTGRHTQRTRAIDTWIGRAMLEPEEVTLAEMLRGAGLSTGIFGKWHLGDCPPMTPNHQGFDHALVHRGGGIGQPADPWGAEGKYTDPVLFENGQRRQMTGYCTDVYFEEAIAWMDDRQAAGERFFAYIPTNAPHGPFHDVPQELLEYYRSIDLSPGAFPNREGQPMPTEWNEARLADIFAMIENIDQNVGRLLDALEEMGIGDDTLVIYMHDNGPNSQRYVSGLRGMKSHVHEGGVRSPLFARWPGALSPRTAEGIAGAHFDMVPTVLDACGVDVPGSVELDGRSLLPVLRGDTVFWPDRHIVIQAHRGNYPVRYHHMMVTDGRWKLVSPSGFGRELESVEPEFELYDLDNDPGEQRDLAAEHPDRVEALVEHYDAWFEDVGATHRPNYDPPRIEISTTERVVLTRQDWRRADGGRGWGPDGAWHVRVVHEGPYNITLRTVKPTNRAEMTIGGTTLESTSHEPTRVFEFEMASLPVGEHRVVTRVKDGDTMVGAYHLVIESDGER